MNTKLTIDKTFDCDLGVAGGCGRHTVSILSARAREARYVMERTDVEA